LQGVKKLMNQMARNIEINIQNAVFIREEDLNGMPFDHLIDKFICNRLNN